MWIMRRSHMSSLLFAALALCAIVAAPVAAGLPAGFNQDNHRVIAMDADGPDTPLFALTNKGIWNAKTGEYVVPASMSTTIPIPIQDAVALYNQVESTPTFWFHYYDSNRALRIGAHSDVEQFEYSYSGAQLLRDGYTRPFLKFGSYVIFSMRTQPSDPIQLMKATSHRAVEPMPAWALPATVTGVSHFTYVNSTFFAFIAWRADGATIILGSPEAGIVDQSEVTNVAVKTDAIDLLSDNGLVVFVHNETLAKQITIYQVLPGLRQIVQSPWWPDATTPFAVLNALPFGGRSNRLAFFKNGMVIFTMADGSASSPLVRFVDITDLTNTRIDLCTACSAVFVEWFPADKILVIAGPLKFPTQAEAWENLVPWSMAGYNFTAGLGDIKQSFAAIQFGTIHAMTGFPSTGTLLVDAHVAPFPSQLEFVSYVFYPAIPGSITSDSRTLRVTCFDNLRSTEFMNVRHVEISGSIPSWWSYTIADTGRSLVQRGATSLMQTVGLVAFPFQNSDLRSGFFPLAPASRNVLNAISFNNAAPGLGFTDTSNMGSRSLINVTKCVAGSYLKSYSYGQDTTLVELETSDRSTQAVAFVKHDLSNAQFLLDGMTSKTIQGAFVAKNVPGLTSWDSHGIYFANMTNSFAQVLRMNPVDASVVGIGPQLADLIGLKDPQFFAHTFGGSSDAIVFFIMGKVISYNTANDQWIDQTDAMGVGIADFTSPVEWMGGVVFIGADSQIWFTADGVSFVVRSEFPTRNFVDCLSSGEYLTCNQLTDDIFTVVHYSTGQQFSVDCVGCHAVELFNDMLLFRTHSTSDMCGFLPCSLVDFSLYNITAGSTAHFSFSMYVYNTDFDGFLRVFKLKAIKRGDRLFIGTFTDNLEIAMISYNALKEYQAPAFKRAASTAMKKMVSLPVDNSNVNAEENLLGPFDVVGPDYQLVYVGPSLNLGQPGALVVSAPLPCVVAADCSGSCNETIQFCEIPEPPAMAPVDAPVDVPVDAPVDAPVSAPASTVSAPVETPVSGQVGAPVSMGPAQSGCVGTASFSGATATCQNGSWTYPGSVNIGPSSLTLSGPAVIDGDLVMTNDSTLSVTLGQPLVVNGCATFAGTLNAVVPAGYQYVNGTPGNPVIYQNGFCGGTPSTFNTVSSTFDPPDPCPPDTSADVSPRNVAVVFTPPTGTCNSGNNSGANVPIPWWVILIIVLAAVLVVAIIIVIVFVNRKKIIPYYRSRDSMREAKKSIAMRQQSQPAN